MKPVIVFLFLMVTLAVYGQNERYLGAMQKNMQALGAARTPEAMLEVVHTFERIGNAEKNQWLPFYYASVAQVWHAFMLNEVKQFDLLADKAEAFLKRAEEMEKNNSEIVLVKAMIASLRMVVDPMTRFMQYSQLSARLVEEAKQLDPANPRPYLWQAQGHTRTPEQFGGGCAAA